MKFSSVLKERLQLLLIVLFVAGTMPIAAQTGLQFDGVNDYVTFGQATTTLGASSFTLEVWFMRTGTGATTTSGTGGIVAVPMLSKGRGESEADPLNMNFFLGINGAGSYGPSNVLAADFEEGIGSTTLGLNHPVSGVTQISNNIWYHAAVTYDTTSRRWQMFLNGNLEKDTILAAGSRWPQYNSTQHAGLGTAMTSTGVAAGFFQGMLDEARIWNHARTQQEIQDNMGLEITSGSGLLGRWGLNDGSGTNAVNSVGGSPNGTLTNGPTWASGTPFVLTFTYQEGTNGYTGTFDNFLRQSQPGTSQGTATTVDWDTEETGGDPNTQKFGLVRFSNIFGSAAGRIPVGAIIDSARLSYFVSNLGDPANVNEVLVDWSESETYNSFGGEPGVQADEYGGTLIASATATTVNTTFTIDVQPSLSSWVIDTSLNRGWIFRPTVSDGVQITSSEGATASQRPLLRVSYHFGPSAPPTAPTNLIVTAITHAQLQLAWDDNSSNESAFEVERSTNGGGTFALFATVGSNTTTYNDFNLNPFTQYCYQVRAINAAGNSGYATAPCATTPVEPSNGLDFGTSSAYVTFGNPATLGLAQFTIETWFRRDGAGIGITTGTGGITSAIPLVTKGTSEAESPANVNMNYFLGIDASTGVLVADFEEGMGGIGPLGQNHPVSGTTLIVNDTWYHAAATYDGANWQLFLNGNLDTSLVVGQPVESNSIQHAALATSIRSNGTAQGFFDGVLDEVRIWNGARTQQQIQAAINSQIAVLQPGLVARWGLNEGTGTAINGGAGTLVRGTITGTGTSWVGGAPFNITVNSVPNLPTLNTPPHNATSVPTPATLDVTVSDPEASPMTVTFYGREVQTTAPPDFTVVGLPDTQFYTEGVTGSNATFKAQTQWIVDNRVARNIAYVAQLGDCVQNGDNGGNDIEWRRADTSMSAIENPLTTGLPDGVPFGISVGNHDQSPIGNADGTTTFYNQFFGTSRFTGRGYYGGHFGANNDNHFQLFSASGLDFIAISFEYDTSPDGTVLHWADSLLKAYSTRRGIVSSHWIINSGNPGTFSTQGQAIYDSLKDNTNLFLMLCGHVNPNGEGQRLDTFNGNTVYSLLSDYQDRTNGGNGWMRILEFSPANNLINVQTYSPTLAQFETDANSQFSIPYSMAGPNDFQVIGTNTGVNSGSNTSTSWSSLSPNTEYEWYVTVSDGNSLTQGPIWRFTTEPPLPIQLASFTASVVSASSVRLDWITLTETNNYGFEVQKSAEAMSGYATIPNSFIPGHGTTLEPQTYAYIDNAATAGTWYYRLKQIDLDGTIHYTDGVQVSVLTGVEEDGSLPKEFALEQNYPNPFNPVTSIEFHLPKTTDVTLKIYNILGSEVLTLLSGAKMARGVHHVDVDATPLASGVYIYRMTTPEFSQIRKMIVLK